MKSRFFTDLQGLDTTPAADRVCLCLLVTPCTLERLLHECQRLGMSSGEYIDHLMLSVCGTTVQPPSYSRPPCSPQGTPDH